MSSNQITAAEIRQAVRDNAELRERDLANRLAISEAQIVAAFCGDGARHIEADVKRIFPELEALGEVMALTRNESAVHEKIGAYDKVRMSAHGPIVLGEQIDLRIFGQRWRYGFAVERRDRKGELRRSLQFFDAAGDAVHKIHMRPQSSLDAFDRLSEKLRLADQPETLAIGAKTTEPASGAAATIADYQELHRLWSAMTDVHQFPGITRKLGLTRLEAVRMIGDAFAWRLDGDCVFQCLTGAAETQLPIMCFVGNDGCIQIHSGPISNLKAMGPWLNVMDPTFHLHLRCDHIVETWAVRKPTKDGHVTSLEAYDGRGRLIIQFFGKRMEGRVERQEWRALVESLPHSPRSSAA